MITECNLKNTKLQLNAKDSEILNYGKGKEHKAIVERAQKLADKKKCTVEIVLDDGDSYDIIYPN